VKYDFIAFDPAELLDRTFAKDQTRDGKLKPNALKPQFSVYRSNVPGDPQPIPLYGKFNGIAEVRVDQVRGLTQGPLVAHCVYEPTKDNEAHSLIAICTDAPLGTALEADFEKLRAAIVAAMTIVKPAV
jgi:hypothetical protein